MGKQIEVEPERLEVLEAEAERGSLSLVLSLPLLMMGLEVEGEDRSSCLSRTSLIRFRSSDLEAETPRSLYILLLRLSQRSLV